LAALRATAAHTDVRTVHELLAAIVTHGLTGVPAWMARVPPMKAGGAPPCRHQLVPIATVVLCRHTTVSCPPAPLQCALRALKILWDAKAEFVGLGKVTPRRQIEALRVQPVNRLAIRSSVVGAAVSRWLHTEKGAQASRRISHGAVDPAVADAHLKVTEVVGCDHMLELDHLASRICCLDTAESVQIPRLPTHSPGCVRPIVACTASGRLADVPVTMRAGENC